MEIVMKRTADIKPYAGNPRDNDNAVPYIAESIKQFGFRVPIVLDQDDVIVCGHTRWKAAQKLGIEEVPTVGVDDLTPEQVKAFRLADNKSSEQATWNLPKLDLELLDLPMFDMSLFGFPSEEVKKEAKKSGGTGMESMELKAFEHHDYLVFVFDNQMDWLNAVNAFGIHKVNAGYGTTKKVGVGRVVNGKRLLERIQYQAADPEPGAEPNNHDNGNPS